MVSRGWRFVARKVSEAVLGGRYREINRWTVPMAPKEWLDGDTLGDMDEDDD